MFKAALGVLGGIRKGISTNVFVPLPSMKLFTVMACIFIGFAVLGALWTFRNAALGYVDMWTGISGLFTLVTSGGSVVCIVALHRFNGSLTGGHWM